MGPTKWTKCKCLWGEFQKKHFNTWAKHSQNHFNICAVDNQNHFHIPADYQQNVLSSTLITKNSLQYPRRSPTKHFNIRASYQKITSISVQITKKITLISVQITNKNISISMQITNKNISISVQITNKIISISVRSSKDPLQYICIGLPKLCHNLCSVTPNRPKSVQCTTTVVSVSVRNTAKTTEWSDKNKFV